MACRAYIIVAKKEKTTILFPCRGNILSGKFGIEHNKNDLFYIYDDHNVLSMFPLQGKRVCYRYRLLQ